VHSSTSVISNPPLSNGIVLLIAREAQHLLHCSCAEFLQRLAEQPSMCLSHAAIVVPDQSSPVMSHMRRLNVCAHAQDVTESLWDAAATAYFHLGDMAGMQAAWSWAQTHPAARSWVPSSPDCYMFLATALTQLYEPMEGITSCCLLDCQHVFDAHSRLLAVGRFACMSHANFALVLV